jgi:hypothetical protein
MRRQRGAAMAEMVLLAPVMILMWMGIDHFRAGYARRLEAMAQAHAAAWQQASSNDGSCFANQEPFAGFAGTDPTAPLGSTGSGAVDSFKSHTSSSIFEYAHVNVEAKMTVKATPWAAGKSGEVKGGSFIACNEVVPPAKPSALSGSASGTPIDIADQDVLAPVWDFVSSLF